MGFLAYFPLSGKDWKEDPAQIHWQALMAQTSLGVFVHFSLGEEGKGLCREPVSAAYVFSPALHGRFCQRSGSKAG